MGSDSCADVRMVSCEFYILLRIHKSLCDISFSASDNDKFTNTSVKKLKKMSSKTDEIYQTTDIRSPENLNRVNTR